MNFVGRHAMVDLYWEPNGPETTNSEILMDAMRIEIEASGATILHEHTNSFNGGGFTGTFVLAESHATVHTWPEYGLATLDIYMCGDCDSFETQRLIIAKLEDNDHGPINRFETKVYRGFVREELRSGGTG